MNKKLILTPLLFMAAIVTTNAQLMFRISGGRLEKPSYILGSMHVLSGDLLDSIPAFLAAENQCQQLFVETDVTDQQNKKERQSAGQQLMALPDGKIISDILGEENMSILQKRMKETCHVDLADSAAKDYLHYQPFLFTFSLNMMIQVEALQKYPAMRNGNMMDGACIKRAKARGWKVGNLDQQITPEEQAKIKETMTPIDEQADSLMALLNNFDERRQKILKYFEGEQNMGDYWSAGDYEGFERFMKPENEASPALYAERNKKWVPIIIEAIKEMPTLFVFGAGHLTGPDGVVRMLRDAGYKVEQLKW
ncbi:TraB/GumN family protein [uncultured Prevotella sp.]|uniref:TraB/GumN family protein n=1 Tax=uncultured Prevotella sp. TaxID=159272 RepID=UPI0025FFF35A|nr:TraB/GumN family protein [uncultured Prevotella sp.]